MTLTDHDREIRRTRIGASEVAAVLGISPYADATPFAVWARLTQSYQRPDADELTAGNYLERAVADWYSDRNGDASIRTGSGMAHPFLPWLSATPDRVVVLHDQEGADTWLLECKTDRNRDSWGEPGTDQVPVHVAAQAQMQLEVTGLDRCDVAVLFKSLDQFACYTVRRDDAVIAHILGELERWHARHIVGGEMPDLDGGNAAASYLKKRYPGGGPLAQATEEQRALVAEYAAVRATIKEREAVRDVLKQRIALELGDANGWEGLCTYRPNKNGVRSLLLPKE